jgi:antitoxin component YwqK of YwqJK toxin-antitoxin module
VDYWFYYYENGNKKEEGHYDNKKKCKWWIFMNQIRKLVKKVSLKRSIKWLFFILQKKQHN